MHEPEISGRPFTELMADLAADVAPHVREQNPADVRRRGRTRLIRHRTAASLLSVALLGGAAGIAATVSHHGVPPVGADGGPDGTPPQATSTPGTVQSSTTSGAPSPAANATAAPPGGTSGADDTSAATTGATDHPPIPADAVNTTAWLPRSELPFATQLHWPTDGPSHIDVMRAAQQDLGTCLGGDPRSYGASGTWQVEPEAFATAGNGVQGQAYNAQLFFSSTSAARQGLAAMKSAYGYCLGKTASAPLVDIVRTTASDDSGFAMLDMRRYQDGTLPSGANAQEDSHEYFVQVGNVVYFLGVYGSPVIDGTGQDPQVLQAMHAALERYWK